MHFSQPMRFLELSQDNPAWFHRTQILVQSAWTAALAPHILSPSLPLLLVPPHSYFLPATSVLCCFSVTPGLEQIPPSAYLSSGRKCTHIVTPAGSLLTISETWCFLPGLFYSHIHPLLPIAPGAFQICHGGTWLQNLPKSKWFVHY